MDLYKRVLRSIPDAHWGLLISTNNDDIDNNSTLTPEIRGKLKWSRQKLRHILAAEHRDLLRQIKLFDDILDCTERVLNPAAHAGNPPLHEREVDHALQLVRQRATTLPPT